MNYKYTVPVLFIVILNCFNFNKVEKIIPLELIKTYPIEGYHSLEPSGLTLHDGNLFAVSDNHDRIIFKIDIQNNLAIFTPHIQFQAPQSGFDKIDWEGITCDDDGFFYLASERKYRILRVSPEGKSDWITKDLLSAGRRHGLLLHYNAGFEGIGLISKSEFVLCIERQPRGLMFIDTDINSKSILAYPFNETKLAIPKGRLADFSDIYIESGTIYTLARFASTIAIIEKTKSGYQEKQFWSFSHIENDPRWAYMDMQFGHAEGLTMDTHKIYIVLDNNGDSRRKDRDDSRPLLFILKRP